MDLLVTQELEFMSVVADRWMSWPHAALIRHDLQDVPTIVVSAALINKNLVLRLGGCNLGGDDVIRPFRQLLYAPLPSSVFWTEARLAALESTSRNAFQRPPADTADFERLLQLEWAARTALVGVVAAIDAYFLLRRRGYREHLDDAAALVSPEVALAGTPSREGALADPAYHLMHRARRQLAAGAHAEATANVCEALRVLAGDEDRPPDEAVLAALSAGRLESWHRAMLEELDVAAPGGAVVPATVMAALRRPPPVIDADEAPSADASDRPRTVPRLDAPSHGPWPRRAVTETRTPATASPGSPRGRQVTETWGRRGRVTPGRAVDTVDILMLGKSNAGKTSYVSSMYETMSNGVAGFKVQAERPVEHQLLRRNARLMRLGTFPEASNRRSVYQFQLWHGEDRVFDFVWRDYRGGALTEGSGSAQAVQLRADMESAGGLVIMVDSTELTGNPRSRAAVRPLVSTAIRLLSQRKELMPVVVALTKWDLVATTAQQTNEAARDLLGGLMDAISGTDHLYGALIPVACGRQPLNVVLPVLWCLHVGIAVRGAALEQRIGHHRQLEQLAGQRQGVRDTVRSWWRGEPTWADIRVRSERQIQSDLISLTPLFAPHQKLEIMLEPVDKFGGRRDDGK